MKLFKDATLKQEVQVIDLGIVLAGETKEFVFYLKNDSEADLSDLGFKFTSKEVSVVEAPKEMKSQESSMLKINWTPSVTLKTGLKTQLTIAGYEIYSN